MAEYSPQYRTITKTMPDWQRQTLQNCFGDLIRDLDVDFVSSKLLEDSVLTTDMWDKIKAKATPKDRSLELLSTIPSLGERAFWSFMEALKEPYRHLYKLMEDAFKDSDAYHCYANPRDSDIYMDINFTDAGYMQPSSAPIPPLECPHVFTNNYVSSSENPTFHRNAAHESVEVTHEITAEVVKRKKSLTQSSPVHLHTTASLPHLNGAYHNPSTTGIVYTQPRFGPDFELTGQRIDLRKGDVVIIYMSFPDDSLAIVLDKRNRILRVPISAIRSYGDPEEEPWFTFLPLTPSQAEQMLKLEKYKGCFQVYPPAEQRDGVAYQLSLTSSSGQILHYPIYKFGSANQLGFREGGITFPYLKDLIEYHKRNRGFLDCRLTKALAEIDEAPTFPADLEIKPGEVEHEDALGKEMGRGSNGSYYQALYKNKIVAIKKPNEERRSKEAIAEEITLIKQLSHPNILKFHGVMVTSEIGLVLESMQDGDLSQWLISNKDLSHDIRIDICQQATSAVRYLHNKRWILHREIAAHNFLVSASPGRDKVVVKLADFSMSHQVI